MSLDNARASDEEEYYEEEEYYGEEEYYEEEHQEEKDYRSDDDDDDDDDDDEYRGDDYGCYQSKIQRKKDKDNAEKDKLKQQQSGAMKNKSDDDHHEDNKQNCDSNVQKQLQKTEEEEEETASSSTALRHNATGTDLSSFPSLKKNANVPSNSNDDDFQLDLILTNLRPEAKRNKNKQQILCTDILCTQNSISSTFCTQTVHAGRPVAELIEKLNKHEVHPDTLKIKVYQHQNQTFYALDHRRLWAVRNSVYKTYYVEFVEDQCSDPSNDIAINQKRAETSPEILIFIHSDDDKDFLAKCGNHSTRTRTPKKNELRGPRGNWPSTLL